MTQITHNCAPALSTDGATLYVTLNATGGSGASAGAVEPISAATAINEVLSVAGITPDADLVATSPNAVREWCVNTAAVSPATKSIVSNNGDGT